MTREELLELAALDAYGLLDEYEAALFTRSFHHAPVGVQDEITRLQAEFASEEAILPDVEPATDLRRRVLGRVAAAVETETVGLAPLAMIGRSRPEPASMSSRRGLGASGQFWRAAAFALASAAIALAYVWMEARNRNELLWEYVIDRETQDLVHEELGPGFYDFLNNAACRKIVLRPEDDNVSMHAVLFVDDESGKGFLYAYGLDGRDCQLTAGGDDAVAAMFAHDFQCRGPIKGMLLNRITNDLAGLTWQITDVATGAIVLRS
ncbi:MAG: hypothetical protein HKO59_10820 [Phycisphaerales bacterium]|nr:hypothetical protein [Phycisphaerae bacterium]NNM26456.1 hypothetical protein [Phycisphaerales bacterium]